MYNRMLVSAPNLSIRPILLVMAIAIAIAFPASFLASALLVITMLAVWFTSKATIKEKWRDVVIAWSQLIILLVIVALAATWKVADDYGLVWARAYASTVITATIGGAWKLTH